VACGGGKERDLLLAQLNCCCHLFFSMQEKAALSFNENAFFITIFPWHININISNQSHLYPSYSSISLYKVLIAR
jgi:hypothetical protein